MNQLSLTPVDSSIPPSTVPITDTVVSFNSTTNESSPTSTPADSSSQLVPIPVVKFYIDHKTLNGINSPKDKQKWERDERAEACIAKHRKTTKIYFVNYVTAIHHVVSQLINKENY